METDPKCTQVSESGTPCQKTLYHASNGEWWDHAGGHWFASDELQRKFDTQHYDAGALLMGLPVTFHAPEDCTKTGACAWR